MTSDDCRPWRSQLGMLAGGLLDDHEQLALEAHLDGCAQCRAELAEIAPVARLLSLADPDRVADRTVPSTRFTLQVLGAVAGERRARKRRRLAQVAASVAVAAAFALGFFVLTAPGPGRLVEFTQAPPGVTAAVELEDRPWGTQVELTVAGLDDGIGDDCSVPLHRRRRSGRHQRCHRQPGSAFAELAKLAGGTPEAAR